MPPFLVTFPIFPSFFRVDTVGHPHNETGVRFRGTRAPKRRDPNFSGPPASTKMASAPELENSKIKPWNQNLKCADFFPLGIKILIGINWKIQRSPW